MWHAGMKNSEVNNGLLVDIGAVGNLSGDSWMVRQSEIANNHGLATVETALPRPMSVMGVGSGNQVCHYQYSSPIAIMDQDGEATLETNRQNAASNLEKMERDFKNSLATDASDLDLRIVNEESQMEDFIDRQETETWDDVNLPIAELESKIHEHTKKVTDGADKVEMAQPAARQLLLSSHLGNQLCSHLCGQLCERLCSKQSCKPAIYI